MSALLNDITFGQYYPGNSVVHRMDPRAMVVLTVAAIVLIFLARVAVAVACTVVFTAAAVALTRMPVKLYLKTLKPIIPIIILTSVINALYVSSGTVVVHVWQITITTGGLLTALYMAVRICLLIITSSLLTYTTSPTQLTDAIERLLSPLALLRLDVHTLAMMMTIALRFIPTLIEETEKIMAAQKARGADLDSGGLMRRVKALVPVLIPLLISSFRRAAELADAMECRCYHGGKDRTRMRQLHLSARDWLAFAVTAAVFGAVVAANQMASGLLYALFTGGAL